MRTILNFVIMQYTTMHNSNPTLYNSVGMRFLSDK